MVNVTVYGGAGEIGGNKIMVESDDTRIMLDFGTRMGYESTFFAKFVEPRSNTEFRDRLIIGALPMVPGIYREDLIRPAGFRGIPVKGRILRPDSELFDVPGLVTFEQYGQEHGRAFLNAILLSHAHLDHTGDITYIHPSVPLYCSPVTQVLVEAIDEVTSFKSDALLMGRPEIEYSKSDMPKIGKKTKSARECINMSDGQEMRLGSVTVKALHIDHSVPGATSYLLTAEGKRVLYTGDIRFHGTCPVSVEDYVSQAGEGIDILICEGTRIDSQSLITEDMVRQQMTDEMRDVKGLVIVDFSWKDTTRYETVRRAAEECGRTFVINGRLAYLLSKLGQYPDSVKVFLKRMGGALYSPDDYSKARHEYGLSADKDIPDSTHYDSGLTAGDIMAQPEKYVLMGGFYDFKHLFDFADADGKIPNSRFIKAQCEPFSDEMEIDEERMINWLEQFGIAFSEGEPELPEGCANPNCGKIRRKLAHTHVSGHASRPELKEMIAKLKPKFLIPVHTEHPEAFMAIAREIESETGHHTEVRIPEQGVPYAF